MKLLKVQDGLIEVENFFLTSVFSDFAGSANITRDIRTGKLKLISNNKIERKFTYNEFVIIVEKENFKQMDDYNFVSLYLGNADYTFGIKDQELEGQSRFWKILKQNDYIQAYSSFDGITWKNIGGIPFSEPITKQGFNKFCDHPVILNDYRVYKNPYVTICNFPENTICELYNKEGKLLKTREFNTDMECKIFLDGKIEGYFIFKNETEELYRSDILDLNYGDMYVISPYNFEVIYQGNVITNTNKAMLNSYEELVSIKNIDTKSYNNVRIGIKNNTNDLIELSFDGKEYEKELLIKNIKTKEIKNIYIRITKSVENRNFNIRDFQLVIEE